MQEKITIKSKQGDISAVLHIPKKETTKIIVHSHGFTSNKDRSRYIETGEELNKNRLAYIRFDFGGSGESYKTEISVSKQINDLKSVIEYLIEKGYNEIGLIGESLGGLVSASVYGFFPDNIKTMVLVAPVTNKTLPVEKYMKRKGYKFSEEGYIEIEKDDRIFKISKQYLQERATVNQKQLLSTIKCPVLIIHGDKDQSVPLKDSKNGMSYLSKDSKLEILPGIDHFFRGVNVLDNIIDWFKKYLP